MKTFMTKNNPNTFKKSAFLAIFLSAFAVFSMQAYAIEKNYAVFGDTDGAIYTISGSGSLNWYQHGARLTGQISWLTNSGAMVGNGWAGAAKVFSGGDGVIYFIDTNGDLFWYRHDGRFNGSIAWANGGAIKKVGSGWNNFIHVFSGGDGVIYGAKADGTLLWYRHLGWLNGNNTWAVPSTGKVVGSGWQTFTKVFSSDNGVVYGIQPNGNLLWYLHSGKLTGSDQWAAASGTVVGSGWNNFNQVFSSGDGIIYAINQTGQLLWHRHSGWLSGAITWASNSGSMVGNGWFFP